MLKPALPQIFNTKECRKERKTLNFFQRVQKSHCKLLNEHAKRDTTRQRESQEENILQHRSSIYN